MATYFLDTEFNGFGGELISLAMVGEDGRELYLLNIDRRETAVDWVAQNVIPILTSGDADPVCTPLNEIGHKIAAFLARDRWPHIIVDWPDDLKYLCQVLITGPGEMVSIHRFAAEVVRVDSYPTTLPGAVQHNALWDARALRHALTSP